MVEQREPRYILFFGVAHHSAFSGEITYQLDKAIRELADRGLKEVVIGAELSGPSIRGFANMYSKFALSTKDFGEAMRPKIQASFEKPPFAEKFRRLPKKHREQAIADGVKAYEFFFDVYRIFKRMQTSTNPRIRAINLRFVELEDPKLNGEYCDALLDYDVARVEAEKARKAGDEKQAAKHEKEAKAHERKMDEINFRRNSAMAERAHLRQVNIPIVGAAHSSMMRYLKHFGHRVTNYYRHKRFSDRFVTLAVRGSAYLKQRMFERKKGYPFPELRAKRKPIGPRHHSMPK